MEQELVHDEAPNQTKPVASWEVISMPSPYSRGRNLRLYVTYSNGRTRILAPSFEDMAGLDRYVARFHKDFAGKEYFVP
jgi:hypothetical protein